MSTHDRQAHRTDPFRPDQKRRRNVEIKARVSSLEKARSTAQRLAGAPLGRQHQLDTYFPCQEGRLKLREIDGSAAQLIWYRRSDVAGPRLSEYCIVEIEDPSTLKRALQSVMGRPVVVEKTREVFLYENVRIHLDDVKGLGTFLELEAALSPDDDERSGRAKLDHLCQQFQITANDLLASSYADLDS